MTNAPATIVITGFLGAGKSTLARHLSERLAAKIFEVDGLKTPAADMTLQFADPQTPTILAVADAVNFTNCLNDPAIGDLMKAQIAAADAVVVTRSDATDAEPTLEALRNLTNALVVVAPYGEINPADLPERTGASGPAMDLTAQFESWDYSGAMTLKSEQAEALLEKRPKGIYRIWGQVKSDKGGLDLQLIGRARQITKIDKPPETSLHALGPKSAFQRFEMDIKFSEFAAASAHLSGLFSHR